MEVSRRIMAAIAENRIIVLDSDDCKEIIDYIEKLENQIKDYELALDPNSYETLEDDENGND